MDNNAKTKKVMVGMSGGVDSSVAALLLKEQGYETAGVTFRLWAQDSRESGCCSADDAGDARAVCHALGIPHYVFNFKDLFREKVVEEFICSYREGRTPNPCISCNRHIKFSAFLEKARAMGFDYIATGHYASAVFDPDRGLYRLKKGAYGKKDQSYVLYGLNQDQLSSLLLPLGALAKEEVRKIASDRGLAVQGKPESQDICFIPDGDYASFLERETGGSLPPGDFVDPEGNRLGTHRGVARYTIGQRRGVGTGFGKPLFVSAIDAGSNTVTLAEDKDLWRRGLLAGELSWIEPPPGDTFRATAKIRYAHRAEPATVSLPHGGGDEASVEFDNPVRAVTPGQAVVFYRGDFVLGGGIIR